MMIRTLLSLSIALTLPACGDKDGDSGGGETDDCISEGLDGAELYTSNCAGCHAADGSGASGPSLADAMVVLSDDDVLSTIQEGKGGMPAFDNTLSCGEQSAVLDYLRDQHGEQGGAASD